MKNLLFTLGLLLAAGVVAYGAFYVGSTDPAVRAAARQGDALVWLKAEFHLDDARFEAIKRVHEDYGAQCGEHCAAIVAARERSAPADEIAALEAVCVKAMTEHFRRVAALMPAGEGERYLATVLPCVGNYDHANAPTVQGRP